GHSTSRSPALPPTSVRWIGGRSDGWLVVDCLWQPRVPRSLETSLLSPFESVGPFRRSTLRLLYEVSQCLGESPGLRLKHDRGPRWCGEAQYRHLMYR